MKRAVITGLGIVSCLGNDREAVTKSLREGISGIRRREDFAEMGLRCNVGAVLDIDPKDHIDRKILRFMGPSSAYAYIATDRAIADAGLSEEQVSNPRTGLVMGSGGVSGEMFVESIDVMRERGIKRAGPYRVTQIMASAVSANVATPFKIKGVNYSLASACATSAHCIGTCYQQIKMGLMTTGIAGGVDQAHWSHAMQFDGMGALSTQFNDQPEKASRPYDKNRDGFVISAGAGIVILEEWEHAKKRGANILGEIIGFGASSDGDNMVAPSGEGAERAIRIALKDAGINQVDYINTHGTSTPRGDVTELKAIENVFKQNVPYISSTKSLSGHGLGAAGVHEAIFSLIMMHEGFISASANADDVEDDIQHLPLVRQRIEQKIETVLSNSFGFGGTNACLVIKAA